MLVLTLNAGDAVDIGPVRLSIDDLQPLGGLTRFTLTIGGVPVKVHVRKVAGRQASVAFDAPRDIRVERVPAPAES